MTCNYPDLSRASDWLKQISHAVRPLRGTTLIWVMSRHQSQGGGEGFTPYFKRQEWSKEFFAFEIFDFGIFCSGKFWQVFFWVDWFTQRFFWVFKTIWRFVIVPSYPGCLVPLEIFMAWKFGVRFLGVKFWSRDFGWLCFKQYARIRSSLLFEIRSTPPGHQNGISALVSQTPFRGETRCSKRWRRQWDTKQS